MMPARRVAALLLALAALPLFMAVAFLLRANATLYTPEFYASELRRSDVYGFVHERLLPAAFDDAAANLRWPRPLDVAPLRDEFLLGAREVFPPAWLQAQAERTIASAVPYIAGDAASFEVTIPVQERTEIAAEVLKANARQGDLFPILYGDLTSFMAHRLATEATNLPLGIRLSPGQSKGYIERVVPPDWTRAQTGEAVDRLEPYLSGETESFRITVPLVGRVEAGGEVLREVLRGGQTYDFIVDQVVTPAVQRNVGDSVEVILGARLTRAEVSAAVRQVLTPEWVGGVQEEFISRSVDYLTGATPTFTLTVPLEEPKRAAFDLLGRSIDQRLEADYGVLAACTLEHSLFFELRPGALPVCRPPGLSYGGLKRLLGLEGVNLGREVGRVLGPAIPDQRVFTEADLRAALGPAEEAAMDRVIRWARQGVTFTETDLRRWLSEEQSKRLDAVRIAARQGVTLTEVDLARLLGMGRGPEARRRLQDLRDILAMLRFPSLLSVALIAMLVLVVLSAAFLGDRGWTGRLVWGAGIIGTGSFLVLLTAAPPYAGIGRPWLERSLREASNGASGAGATAGDKSVEVMLGLTDRFMAGFWGPAAVLLLVALGVVAGSLFMQGMWARNAGRRRMAEADKP